MIHVSRLTRALRGAITLITCFTLVHCEPSHVQITLLSIHLPKGLNTPKSFEAPIPKRGIGEYISLLARHAVYSDAVKNSKIHVKLTWKNQGSTTIEVCRPYQVSTGGTRFLLAGETLVVFDGYLSELDQVSGDHGFISVQKAKPLQALLRVDFVPERPVQEDLELELKTWFIPIFI